MDLPPTPPSSSSTADSEVTSEFDRSSDLAGGTSQFDASRIDSNLRAISAVESKWRLPQLPDEVKMDLAFMPDVDSGSLTNLLLGLDSDFNDFEDSQSEPELLVPDFMPDRTAADQFRVYAAGIAGERHPTELSPDAVQRFKWDAVQRGYLSADTKLDSSWSPELNSVRREVLYDDYDKRLSGNRPGAISAGKVLEQVGKWTSPTGLLAAATELDLFWDFTAIDREWSSWGDKWRKLGDSKNPLDFAKNLVDAVTGPVDDIVFPALNLMMLTTGVGALANSGRIAMLGTRAAEGGRLMRGLYSASQLALPSSLGQITEASWTAQRLMAHEGALGAVGRGLQAWRELEPVARVKQAMQVGMRAGFMSQAEDLLPGYQGGRGLPGLDGVQRHIEQFGNGVLSTPVELALAPYNIFNPGTFFRSAGEGANLVTRAGAGFVAAGGTLPGRAALGGLAGAAVGELTGDDLDDVLKGATYGAVGAALLPHAGQLLGRAPGFVRGAVGGAVIGGGVALVTDVDPVDGVAFGAATGASLVPLSSVWSSIPNPGKWVGYASDVVSKFSYRPIAEDQRVAMAFQKGIRRALGAEGKEALDRWDQTFTRTNSFVDTLADFLGTDAEGASAAVAYATISAAIDYTAKVQAGGSADAYHLFRNKLVAQLRTFDLEGDVGFLPEEVARAVAIDRAGGHNYDRAYQRILSQLDHETARELAAQHNDTARRTLEQLMSVENLPDLDRTGTRIAPWADATSEDRIGVIEAYLPQVLPTFGNWPLFSRQTQQVQSWVNDGLLDGAEFLPVATPYGSFRQVKANVIKIDPKVLEADDQITDSILRDSNVRSKVRNRLAPLARVQPSGRFTLARHETITKQQLEQTAYELEDLVKGAEHIKYLTQTGVMKSIREVAPDGLRMMDRDTLASFIRANGFGKNDSQLRYIHSFMNRHGIDDSSLAAMIDQQISSIVEDGSLWAGLGLDPIIRNSDNVSMQGLPAMQARIKEVRNKARYTAAEIDESSVVASVRQSHGDAAAHGMLGELEAMRNDGYKLVHGVEYLMPHDLASSGLFRDIGVREANAATLGNAFGRRHPAVARLQQERRERSTIVKALADHDLGDFDPQDERITQAYGDLRAILNEIQDPIAQRLEERQLMSFLERKRVDLDSAFAPLRLEDLTKKQPFVVDRLEKMGWSTEQAEAIFSSLRHFRNTEFKDLGLYAFEAKMRERNELVQALKWIGGSKYGDSLISSNRLGMAAGAFAGQDYAVGALDEDASDNEVLGARIAGLAGGALLGAGAAAGAGALARRNGWVDDAIRRAEQKPAFMLGDRYARMRDGLRFALSPMFDASRYTEGLMLSQTGVPLRHPETGARIALPLNMSPTGVKGRIGERAFQDARTEFRQLAMGRGVGDLDVLDDAGHWFAQIGVMGFNPQDWQVGAYAELRRQGINAKEAFEAAHATHTYGTRGRSPAELSVNFVFFPFSFQKKALGHVAKWMNDDLGRSILIHDGLAAYQALDEHYDLDEVWRDYLPAMDMLNRFNLLAYGVSPGRFGGINSQLFETFGRSLVMFSPVGVHIEDRAQFLELQKLQRSLLPVYNDMNWMIEEYKAGPGAMAASGSHKTRSGQISDGYREWNEYRDSLSHELQAQGYDWSDLNTKPWLADVKNTYEAKRAELGRRYPEWTKSRQESIFNVQALEMERNDLLALAVADPTSAPARALLLASFESQVAEVKRVLGLQRITVDGADGWLDAPPWAFDYLHERAAAMLQADSRFKGIYKTFYERELGPLEAGL